MSPLLMAWSARVTATIASTTGTALGTMHGSCLPPTLISASLNVARSTVLCVLAMLGVGLKTARTTMGAPVVMPPRTPPELFVAVPIAPALDCVGVVRLRAPHGCEPDPSPELDRLDGGDREERLGDVTLDGVEDGLPDPSWEAEWRRTQRLPPTLSPTVFASSMTSTILSDADGSRQPTILVAAFLIWSRVGSGASTPPMARV